MLVAYVGLGKGHHWLQTVERGQRGACLYWMRVEGGGAARHWSDLLLMALGAKLEGGFGGFVIHLHGVRRCAPVLCLVARFLGLRGSHTQWIQ